ncbi:energy-coupling factor transport system ATP-binding protein [Malonomonas rubra DSM 5091]|uniref:Energy-coupling factor transport system ATP-binding protein n=1 Tax=Malonomonas rubra DSM 5091 TaxID=1122189 RepID=A0A1M6E3F1_MALRU|nr:ABC transporter ATP-binding protein [Malonomonas rubra]SHI79909.1 energy-coupling factor transport system ATP-binding protein [Malonomonas rubra DSM 5091]
MHDLKRQPPIDFDGPTQIEICDLHYSYPGGLQALNGINLRVAEGDRIALVGQNGSGKSTLINHLNGLLPVQQGELRYKGKPLAGEHLLQARLEIGVLFQDPDDQLFCSALYDDVCFGPLNQGMELGSLEPLVRQSLASVGLEELIYKPSHHLSYGQKKRAALACLLAMKPQVLILDEPTANLDSLQENMLVELLRHYRGTLICITHDLLFAFELCQRAIVLDKGQVHHDYRMDDLVADPPSMREHGLDFSFRLCGVKSSAAVALETKQDLPTPQVEQSTISNPLELVALDHYRYRYSDGTLALRDVDFSLQAGESVAIVGENGAGKTTMLNCLLGIFSGEGGHRFAGAELTKKQRRLLWRKVGMVFQDPADQLFCASCAEEVGFGPKQLGLPKDEVKRRVDDALKRVKLDGYQQRVPLHLSGGERKRLAIAAVLSMQPELLILDEPSAGLDPQGEELLLEILRELPQGKLLVSHDPFLVAELTSRTLVMHRGKVLADYSTAEFLADQQQNALSLLAPGYKRACERQVLELQHRHEHAHLHRHYHEHPHRHGDIAHSHPHEHEHDHDHVYTHSHIDGDAEHSHSDSLRYHEHSHPGHENEEHDHLH